jgi:coenzyme F420-reducing hydrogenase gamma subunit
MKTVQQNGCFLKCCLVKSDLPCTGITGCPALPQVTTWQQEGKMEKVEEKELIFRTYKRIYLASASFNII